MNSPSHNIYTASGVAQDKMVRVRALGRKVFSKSKLQFSPKADRNWKSSNAFATRLGRQMGAATVSVLEFVPNIGIFAWATGTLWRIEPASNFVLFQNN